MVSALHSKSSCPGFSSGQGHHAVFLGKKMSKCFFFHTSLKMDTSNLIPEDNPLFVLLE